MSKRKRLKSKAEKYKRRTEAPARRQKSRFHSSAAMPGFKESARTFSPEDKQAFWDGFLRAVETQPVTVGELTGNSGLTHPAIALGIDEERRRMVVVSGDPDGRAAALAQMDLQNAYPEQHVILARPIPVNLTTVARAFAELVGKDSIEAADFKKLPKSPAEQDSSFQEKMQALVERGFQPAFRGLSYAALHLVGAWQDVITQIGHLEFESARRPDGVEEPAEFPTIRLGRLLAYEPAATDRRLGVCPVPLYELSQSDVEVLSTDRPAGEVQAILKAHDLLQYFFPAPDHLALGVIERSPGRKGEISQTVARAPSLGHPFGESEIVTVAGDLREMIDALEEKRLCVEGEFGVELTSEGRAARASVKFKPRESLLAKIARIVSLKLDISLKDIFR